jgi:hypothetical protein
MKSLKYSLAVVACSLCMTAHSQKHLPQIEVENSLSVKSGPLSPLWLYANEWGKYNMDDDPEASFYLSIKDTLVQRRHFLLKAGIGGMLKAQSGGSFLHQAYISGRVYGIDYSVGLEAFSPIAYDDKLTSGNYLVSNNARPIPRVALGIYEWTSVPLLKQWVQIRGGISQGYLDDNTSQRRGHEQVYLHEKFAYARLSHYAIKPYMGLMHSALFGGKGIEVDFWSTFFAKGSQKVGGGEATNAAGAHMGLYDFGFDWDNKLGKLHFYLHKPFADGSGMHINKGYNKDYYCGFVLYPSNQKLLKGINVEVFKTSYQSGNGMPDPMYPAGNPKAGQLIFPSQVANIDQFMLDELGITTSGWGRNELETYLEETYNHGNMYGGRDDNMNNGMYYGGWSYYGMSTGTPLCHTVVQVAAYAPEWSFDRSLIFVNNRVNGFNVGFNGQYKKLGYLLKFTFTKNYGSYSQEYPGRYTWNRVPYYYYDTHVKQYYNQLELTYPLLKNETLKAKLNVGLDYGELYHAEGVRLSLCWTPAL